MYEETIILYRVNSSKIVNDIRAQICEAHITVAEQYLASPYYEKTMGQLKNADSIVIVGAGVYGRRLYEMLEAEEISDKVAAVCDNSKEMQQGTSFSKVVLSVEEAVRLHPNSTFVITPRFYENELLQQLVGLGVDVTNILIWTFAYTGLID